MAPDHRLVTEDDITNLRQLLKGTSADVRSPKDNDYAASVQRWSKAAEKNAGVAVVPTTSEEVSIAIKYANEHQLDVAVKGGGHSTAGASSTQGGLLIDLGRMQAVEIDEEKQQVRIQGGALWGQVDAEAWKYGLATVGGTVADTGVGGLTLGGGYGHLSGKYGLVIDNTVSFTVVLANGTIEKVSRESYPDLFWAMNGAGQNFGVTTEFVLQAYPQGDVFAATLLFPPTPEIITSVTNAVNQIWQITSGKTTARGRAGCLLGFLRPPQAGGQTMLIAITVFNGPEAEGRALLRPLYDIGPVVNDSRTVPYPTANTLAPAIYGMRSSMKGSSFKLPLRPAFVNELHASFDNFLNSCPDAAASAVAFEVYDPTEVARRSAGSFANRGTHLNSLIMPMWSDAANDGICRQFARDLATMFQRELEKQGSETGQGVEGGVGIKGPKQAVMLYGNYDQYDEKSRDIFGVHYERLQGLKTRYDPQNLFNKLHSISPKTQTNGVH